MVDPAIIYASSLRPFIPVVPVDIAAEHVAKEFGIFIHFGLETFVGVEYTDGSSPVNTWAPTALTGAAIQGWIDAAVASGATYAVLTSKHHSGFCLWPTVTTGYGIADTSWYASTPVDIVLEFTTRCRAAGLQVGLYYSPWDRNWELSHPGFNYTDYGNYLKSHLSELLDGTYGQIDYVWLDGWGWYNNPNGPSFDEIPYHVLYNHIKSLQPNALVMVNIHTFLVFNTEIVGYEYPAADGIPPADNTLPSEVCDTIQVSGKWFWWTGQSPMSKVDINARRDLCNARYAAYLLNVPPDTTGAFPAAYIARLEELPV